MNGSFVNRSSASSVYPKNMILCEENCSLPSTSSVHWSDLVYVLAATCTTTVSAALNLGLLASTIFGGVVTKYPVTLQLCACGLIACSALSCHIQHIWKESVRQLPYSNSPFSVPCRILDLATLFSHCSFVCLMSLEMHFSHHKVVIPLLSIISWCVITLVSLAAGMHYSPSSSILVFCFYVLHIPLIALLVVSISRSSRVVAPLGVENLRPSCVRRIVPHVLLFFVGTMPQAFLVAAEALQLKPFSSADAWCCLMTSLFAAFRPVFDTFFKPELGDTVVEWISSFCRRKRSA